MIELAVLLMFALGGLWLFFALLWLVFRLAFGLLAFVLCAFAAGILCLVAAPILLLLSPLLLLALLPVLIPALFVAFVLWLLLRTPRRAPYHA